MAQVNFRIDDETKRQAEALFAGMGFSMTGAIMVFIRQALNERAIPFKVHVPEDVLTKEELLRRIDDMEHGRNCHFHELIEVDDEETNPKAKPRRTSHRRRRAVA